MTLVEFLLARIEEDELFATAALNPGSRLQRWDPLYVADGDDEHISAHIARFDPHRMLAECAAKRAVVEAYDEAVGVNDAHHLRPGADSVHGPALANLAYRIVWELAKAYLPHDNFSPEWEWDPRRL